MKTTTQLFVAALLVTCAATADAQEADVPKAQPIPTATPATSGTPTKAKPIAKTPAVRPLSVTVGLVDGRTKLVGTLTDTNSLDMRTSFGTVDVPLSEVAGFRFPSEDDPKTTVVMLNGDSITGATDVKLVTVETEWGVAQINGQSIQSILFVPSLTWSSTTGLNGKRWSLSEPKKEPAPPRTPAARTAQPQRAAPPATRQTFPTQPQFNRGFGN